MVSRKIKMKNNNVILYAKYKGESKRKNKLILYAKYKEEGEMKNHLH